jgi:hypothetical protein
MLLMNSEFGTTQRGATRLKGVVHVQACYGLQVDNLLFSIVSCFWINSRHYSIKIVCFYIASDASNDLIISYNTKRSNISGKRAIMSKLEKNYTNVPQGMKGIIVAHLIESVDSSKARNIFFTCLDRT